MYKSVNKLISFHGDPAIKAKYLKRVKTHAAADNLIQGTGWENGKGCAVGCTLELYDHKLYPIELGLPEWLAHLEDRVFEGLPKADAMKWPAQFLKAIPVGVDVEPVRHKLAIRRLDRLTVLQETALAVGYKHGVDKAISQTISALRIVRACHEAEMGSNVCDWSAARAAARAAESARAAAWAARSARAAESAESAWKQEAKDLLELLCEVKK